MRWLVVVAVAWLSAPGVVFAQSDPHGAEQEASFSPPKEGSSEQDDGIAVQQLMGEVDQREAIRVLRTRIAELEFDAEVGSAEARIVRLERVAELEKRLAALEQPGDADGLPAWVTVLVGLLGAAVGAAIRYGLEWRKVQQGDTKLKHDLWMKLVEVVLAPGVRFEQRMSYLSFLAQVAKKGGKVDAWAKASFEAHEKVAPKRPERWRLMGEISDKRAFELNRLWPAAERERTKQEREVLEQQLSVLENEIRTDMPDFPFSDDSPPTR